jgi:transcriptional regulator with PAS, ATPase and Fis domain
MSPSEKPPDIGFDRGVFEELEPAQQDAAFRSEGIVGFTPPMQRIYRLIAKIAPTESTVFVTGESGTGKELVARAIHYQSRRADRLFLAVNCGALPEALFESELFGHVRGAFTGAITDRKGLFHQADGGTLFLDEIAEMPPSTQVKLLRVLQEGEVRRVGEQEHTHVDVRVIAATNRDPWQAVSEGRLREDLFYRLNVFHIEMPPLRERREDIPLLARYFLEKYSTRFGKSVTSFSNQAQFFLMRHDYPGNVRELENIVQGAVVLAEGDVVVPADLPPHLTQPKVLMLEDRSGEAVKAAKYDEDLTLAQVEQHHIKRTLERSGGNVSEAARKLGISRSTLWRKMKEMDNG